MQWNTALAPRLVSRVAGLLTLLGAVLLSWTALAQQPPGPGLPQPRLLTIMPMGGKVGTAVEVVLAGVDLEDPQGLLFSHPNIKAEAVGAAPPPPPDPNKKGKGKAAAQTAIKFKVTIGADVPVGTHDVRIINKWGVSNPRCFVVGDLNEVLETEPNNDVAQAQRVELNTTVNGTISTPTDIDYFVFAGKKGQRVVVSCLASSIDSRLNPVLEIYDSAGKRLAANRDYHEHDAVTDITPAADGDYYVRVGQFTYTAGTAEYFYRLSITTAPWIDAVFPPMVELGKPAQLTVYGRNLPGGQLDPLTTIGDRALEKLTVTVNPPGDPVSAQKLAYSGYITPQATRLDGMEYRLKNPSGSSNGVLLTYARAGVVVENPANAKRESAQELTLPCEVAGRLEKKRSQGWYSFNAKKGDVHSIEVLSDRLGSPTDLVLGVYGADGKLIVELDDDPEILSPTQFFTRTSDPPRYKFVAPADGKFLLHVKNQDSSGQLGPRAMYRLRITPEQPDFRLVLMPTSTFNPEGTTLRQGGHQEYTVFVWRLDGFNGEINLSADGLPEGISCKPQTVSPGAKSGLLVVSAGPEAQPWTGEIKIKGTANINGQEVIRVARAASITWPGQPQQNVPTFTRLEHGVVLAVRDKAPFVLNAETDKATVLHGNKVTIPLKVERLWPDLKAPVAVTLALVPTGGQQQPANQAITVAPVTIAADKTDGSAVIDVKATAPPGTYTIVFRGSVQTQFGKDPMKKANATIVQPSSPVLLTVLPKQVANVTVAPPNATVKVGNQTEVTVKVARLHEYAGEFKVLLVLPPNTKGINAAEVTIPAGKDETKLVISLEADAPVGNQAGLLVRATATVGGSHVTIQDAKFTLNVTK